MSASGGRMEDDLIAIYQPSTPNFSILYITDQIEIPGLSNAQSGTDESG
jgi:hypothetical protein